MNKSIFVKIIVLSLFSLFVVSVTQAATVTLLSVGEAQVRDGVYAGRYELDIDGISVLAMCDDRLTEVGIGDSWDATFYTFSDVQNGAPVKFASGGIQKYSQAGYLFSLLDSVPLSDRADINLAIWEIMSPGSTVLTAAAQSYYNLATSGTYDTFDFSGVMWVLTPTPYSASQEYLVAPLPLPEAAWLLMSGLAGFTVVARRGKSKIKFK